MASGIEQHFRPDETPIIDSINEWITQAVDQYRPILSHFLNPRQRYIATTLVNQHDDVKLQGYGGVPEAEMQRLLIYPAYYEPSIEDFQIQILEIKYPAKFAELKHRQILGTLVSQGIERETFGDIISDGSRWQVIVEQSLADFIRLQVDKIANIRVQLVAVDQQQAVTQVSDWETVVTTVSSLRVDAVVAAAFNYSRNRAKELIEHGKVRLNWAEVEKPDYPVALHDLLSVRHGGRIKLSEIGNVTKKNKIRVTLTLVAAK